MYSINATFVTSCNTTKVHDLDGIVPRPSTQINTKRISATRINLLCWYMFIINATRSCNERTCIIQCRVFLPVSQRVEMNYIFSDNIRILYISWYVKSPKETRIVIKEKKQASFLSFLIVSSVKSALLSINAVNVSYRRSTWIRYQKTISWSVIKYNKKYPVNATAQIEQMQDKKNNNGTAKKYY